MKSKSHSTAAGSEGQLAEVWGDVVSRPQLAKAILIGAVLSVSIYLLAVRILDPLDSPVSIKRAFAMLVGIIGALAGGAICSLMFRPKRILAEKAVSALTWQAKVLEQLEQDEGDLGSLAELPHKVSQEMRAIGVYEAFKLFDSSKLSSRGNTA